MLKKLFRKFEKKRKDSKAVKPTSSRFPEDDEDDAPNSPRGRSESTPTSPELTKSNQTGVPIPSLPVTPQINVTVTPRTTHSDHKDSLVEQTQHQLQQTTISSKSTNTPQQVTPQIAPAPKQKREASPVMERRKMIQSSDSSYSSMEVTPQRPKGFAGLEIDPKDIVQTSPPFGGDRGQQGIVYRANVYGQEVCVKEIKLPKDKDGKKEIANFKNEVQLLSQITHKNVCMFLGACLESGKWRLVMELCKSDLSDVVFNPKHNLTLTDQLTIARDIAKGMAWLHQCGVLHLDMKIENFLVDEYGTVKVSDFGFSRIYEDILGIRNVEGTSEGGAPLYKSPERLLRQPYAFPADVYSFTILFWQILARDEPFRTYQEIGDVGVFRTAVCVKKERPPLDAIRKLHLPDLEKLLISGWSEDPEERPTFRQIIKQLDTLMVDASVQDPEGRAFWKDCFIEKAPESGLKSSTTDYVTLRNVVPWSVFAAKFAPVLRLSPEILEDHLPHSLSEDPLPDLPSTKQIQNASEDVLRKWGRTSRQNQKVMETEIARRVQLLKFNCLRFFLVENDSDGNEVVSLMRFGKIIDIFGPVKPGKNELSVLDKMFQMMNNSWFHGDISQKEAFSLLSDRPVGSFILRFSGTRNSFVISSVIPGKKQAVKHFRLIHEKQESGGFTFTIEGIGSQFPSIEQLITQNEHVFKFPVSAATTRYKFLLSIPSNVDVGYNGEEDLQGSGGDKEDVNW